MHNDTPELTDKETLDQVRALLEEHVPLEAEGYTCTTEDVLNVLVGAAANRGTIESVCADLVGTPDPETIRRYLKEQLTVEELPELERRVNDALAEAIPARVWRQEQDIAIDFHDRPYYGTTWQEEGLWVRGKARDGTTRFYRVATAYVIRKGVRVTLALRFVLPEDTHVTVLDHLLHRVRALGTRIRRLFLDKGFASIAVMQFLSQQRVPAVIACPIRGKQGGTRALCQGRKSYRISYTFKNSDTHFTTELAVCRAFTTSKRTGRMKRRATWLVFILIHLDLPPHQVRKLYRKRFGVETNYRCARRLLGWTTSRNPAYRFFLIGLGFLLVNVWIFLQWHFTQVPRRGRRWLDTKRFQLTRFANFLVRALQHGYGYVSKIVAPAPPIP